MFTHLFQFEARQTVCVGRLPQAAPVPLAVSVITFPKCDVCVCDWSTGASVGEKCKRLGSRRFKNERRVRNQNDVTR